MTADADALLFTTLSGERGALEDVMYDGLDHDYGARVPALEHLCQRGTAAQALYACALLAAWAHPGALRTIARWARAPELTPWAGAPVTHERFEGADAAFELLAHALGVAQDARARDATTDALRAEAMRALLDGVPRVYTGRKLYEVMDLDPALRDAVRDAIGPAVERGVEAVRDGAPFDVAMQVASLVGSLAAVDDARAAAAAEALLVTQPSLRAQTELAYALRHGTGAATLAMLEALSVSSHAQVREHAGESLALRRR